MMGRSTSLSSRGLLAGAAAVLALAAGFPAPASGRPAPARQGVETDIERVIAEVRQSVVTVISRREEGPDPRDPRGRRRMLVGSGVVYDDQGHIVTTASVADEDALLTIETLSGERFPARLLARDPAANVALLEITARDLAPLRIAASSALVPGASVVLLGYSSGSRLPASAFGTVTGPLAVSGLGDGESVVRVDASVRRGWSGGPVLNSAGELVGLVAGQLDASAPGFAVEPPGKRAARDAERVGAAVVVPIEQVREVFVRNVLSPKTARGFLGVRIVGLTEQWRDVLGAGAETEGVVVAEVVQGSPAAVAGIRPGDVIVGFAGSPVSSVNALTGRVAATAPGSEAEVVALRDGKELRFAARIGELPTAIRDAGESLQKAARAQEREDQIRREIERLEKQLERYRRELQDQEEN
jgi:S1-C subfamily serine protease